MDSQNGDYNFKLKCRIAKTLILELKRKDKILAAKWLHKLLKVKLEEDQVDLRDQYMQLFLMGLQQKRIVGPFKDMPVSGDGLHQFDDDFQPDNFSTIVLKEIKENPEPVNIDVAISGDMQEYVASQVIPKFGIQFFYAYSVQPIQEWENVNKASIPKAVLGNKLVFNIDDANVLILKNEKRKLSGPKKAGHFLPISGIKTKAIPKRLKARLGIPVQQGADEQPLDEPTSSINSIREGPTQVQQPENVSTSTTGRGTTATTPKGRGITSAKTRGSGRGTPVSAGRGRGLKHSKTATPETRAKPQQPVEVMDLITPPQLINQAPFENAEFVDVSDDEIFAADYEMMEQFIPDTEEERRAKRRPTALDTAMTLEERIHHFMSIPQELEDQEMIDEFSKVFDINRLNRMVEHFANSTRVNNAEGSSGIAQPESEHVLKYREKLEKFRNLPKQPTQIPEDIAIDIEEESYDMLEPIPFGFEESAEKDDLLTEAEIAAFEYFESEDAALEDFLSKRSVLAKDSREDLGILDEEQMFDDDLLLDIDEDPEGWGGFLREDELLNSDYLSEESKDEIEDYGIFEDDQMNLSGFLTDVPEEKSEDNFNQSLRRSDSYRTPQREFFTPKEKPPRVINDVVEIISDVANLVDAQRKILRETPAIINRTIDIVREINDMPSHQNTRDVIERSKKMTDKFQDLKARVAAIAKSKELKRVAEEIHNITHNATIQEFIVPEIRISEATPISLDVDDDEYEAEVIPVRDTEILSVPGTNLAQYLKDKENKEQRFVLPILDDVENLDDIDFELIDDLLPAPEIAENTNLFFDEDFEENLADITLEMVVDAVEEIVPNLDETLEKMQIILEDSVDEQTEILKLLAEMGEEQMDETTVQKIQSSTANVVQLRNKLQKRKEETEILHNVILHSKTALANLEVEDANLFDEDLQLEEDQEDRDRWLASLRPPTVEGQSPRRSSGTFQSRIRPPSPSIIKTPQTEIPKPPSKSRVATLKTPKPAEGKRLMTRPKLPEKNTPSKTVVTKPIRPQKSKAVQKPLPREVPRLEPLVEYIVPDYKTALKMRIDELKQKVSDQKSFLENLDAPRPSFADTIVVNAPVLERIRLEYHDSDEEIFDTTPPIEVISSDDSLQGARGPRVLQRPQEPQEKLIVITPEKIQTEGPEFDEYLERKLRIAQEILDMKKMISNIENVEKEIFADTSARDTSISSLDRAMAGPSRISSPLTRVEQLRKESPRRDFSALDMGHEYLEDIEIDTLSSGSEDYYPIISPSQRLPPKRTLEPFDWGFLGDVQPFPRPQTRKTKRVSIQSPSGEIRVPGISRRSQMTRPGSVDRHQLTRLPTTPSTPNRGPTQQQPMRSSRKPSQTVQCFGPRKIAGSSTPVAVRRPSKPRI